MMQFLRTVPNLAHLPRPHLRVFSAGLGEMHFKPGETVMDQGRVCQQLYILKHGRVTLLRIVRKDSVSINEFSEVFHKVYESLPEQIEIEVNIKHNPGDLLLLPEIIKSVPSKYKIKAVIPTCILACDVEHIYKNVGIEKFLEIPDAEYLGTSDKLFLKYHIEKLGWDKCRFSIVQEKVVENMRRDFYIGSKNRYMNKIPPMRPAPIQKLVNHYLKSKLQFFSDQGVNRVKSLNPTVDRDSDHMPQSVKLLFPAKTTASDTRQRAL